MECVLSAELARSRHEIVAALAGNNGAGDVYQCGDWNEQLFAVDPFDFITHCGMRQGRRLD